jgi:hypothetical protein
MPKCKYGLRLIKVDFRRKFKKVNENLGRVLVKGFTK